MATSLTANTLKCFSRSNRSLYAYFVRSRWRPADREEEILPSYEERLKARNESKERPVNDGIDIGFHFTSATNKNTNLERLRKWTKERHKLEKPARHQQLQLDLVKVKEEWKVESGPVHISRIAKHYGIFHDMFDGAHFYPTLPLHIAFDYDEEFVTPAYYGNVVPAKEAVVQPYVYYQSDNADDLWTLVMTSPDGNLESNDKELLHWMVCNIPQDNLEKGEIIHEYMQPFPVKGAGFLRYVFILYKQARRLDLSEAKQPSDSLSLRDRTFSTLDFYRNHENNLTPAGLAFFQSEWDGSVRTYFHKTLDMPEPAFEFIHPPPYLPPQVAYPHKEPFNLYLDRYRDKKDIHEEVLKHKLKDVDPFSPPTPRPKYPNAELLSKETPSWLRLKIQSMRLGHGQWKDLYQESKE